MTSLKRQSLLLMISISALVIASEAPKGKPNPQEKSNPPKYDSKRELGSYLDQLTKDFIAKSGVFKDEKANNDQQRFGRGSSGIVPNYVSGKITKSKL